MFNVTLADEDTCPNVVVDVIDLDIALADSWKRFVDSSMPLLIDSLVTVAKIGDSLTRAGCQLTVKLVTA